MKTHSLNRNVDEARYRLTREIRESPLLCVGLALGVGAVIGALGCRASSHHRPARSRWLADVASELTDDVHRLGSRAKRARHQAGRSLHSTLDHATDALPDVAIDDLVRRGRRWLRSVVS